MINSRAIAARLDRLEQAHVAPADIRPWVEVLVDGETEADAYKRQFGVPYPADPDDLPHNVIFRVIVDP